MVTIRKATLKDVPTVVKLWKEFMAEHDKIVVTKNARLSEYMLRKKTAPEKFRKYIFEHLQNKTGQISLAEIEGKVAGYNFALIKTEIPVFKLKKLGLIADLFVKKSFRGLGISSRLVDSSIRWLKKRKIKVISITLYPDNEHAHNIYKKWDFFDYKIEMRKKI